MHDDQGYHRILDRQLRRLGLSLTELPDPLGWSKLLSVVNRTYGEAEVDRYTLERSIAISSEEMRGLHDVLSRQARQDGLTGLPNRTALIEMLDDTLAGHRLGDVAVLFIDLDGFKLVNDSLGHAAGDKLLLHASERIRAATRDGDLVARLGGDEFVVVCVGMDDIGTAVGVARRIAAELEAPVRLGCQDAVVSASIGIALAGIAGGTADDILRKADMAMYEAKAAGRCQFVIFDESSAG
jgi:diguanylate cyclase (GGDEF)-like protein